MSAKTKGQARYDALEIVKMYSAGALLTGWIPGSTFFLTGTDVVMIRQVANAFGISVFDETSVKAHLASILGSAVGGGVAAELFGGIPIIGWIGKSVWQAKIRYAIGGYVISYFDERSPLFE